MKNTALILLAFALFLTGCDAKSVARMVENGPYLGKEETQSEEEKPLPYTPVEDIDLAKILLKRDTGKEINITRDPFKPIITEENNKEAATAIPTDSISDIKLIGVVKMDDEFHALVRSNNKQLVLKKNDTLHDYILKSIEMDQIVFSKGDKTITIKRGDKK